MAKVLIFRRFDDLVKKAEWYSAGYKRNIVSYSIAKLIFIIKSKRKVINYGKIWNTQKVSEELEDTLMEIGELACEHITNEAIRPEGSPLNTGEYAKSQLCWDLFKKVNYSLSEDFERILISKSENNKIINQSKKEQNKIDEVLNEKKIFELGSEYFSKLRKYFREYQLISPQDDRLLSQLESGRLLTYTWQYKRIINLIKRAEDNGFN